MKILLVGTLTSTMNGSARSFRKLAIALSSQHDVVAVLPDREGVADMMMKDKHCQLVFSNLNPIRRSAYYIVRSILSSFVFLKLLITHRPEHVHINDIPWFYLIFASRLLGIPVTIHSRYYEENKFVRNAIVLALKQANSVAFVSDFNRRLWFPGLTSEKLRVINNPGVFLTAPDAVDRDKYGFLTVSRISEDKGVMDSVRFFSNYVNATGKGYLTIVGGCQYREQFAYRERCVELVKELGIEKRVTWIGEESDVSSYYFRNSIYVHLPRFEDPFPTTIMEALNSNISIVTNRKGGIPEQVAGFDGVVFIDEYEHDFVQQASSSIVRDKKYLSMYGVDSFRHKICVFVSDCHL